MKMSKEDIERQLSKIANDNKQLERDKERATEKEEEIKKEISKLDAKLREASEARRKVEGVLAENLTKTHQLERDLEEAKKVA